MSDPIALKLRQRNGLAEIEIRVAHPMEPGDATPQKAASRRPLFLQSMTVLLNEKTVVEGQLSASLAKDPRFIFAFPSVKAGDKFTVICVDNSGKEFKNELVAKF